MDSFNIVAVRLFNELFRDKGVEDGKEFCSEQFSLISLNYLVLVNELIKSV